MYWCIRGSTYVLVSKIYSYIKAYIPYYTILDILLHTIVYRVYSHRHLVSDKGFKI